nr:MAG TPA: hypothetical protein [Caudoviricetes sp.]
MTISTARVPKSSCQKRNWTNIHGATAPTKNGGAARLPGR